MINAVTHLHQMPNDSRSQEVVPLAERLAITSNEGGMPVPDPDAEAFYQALMNAGPDFDASAWLKTFINADGQQPFRTTGPQMVVLQNIMNRLKEEGQLEAPVYALAKAAFSKAFSMNFMLKDFMATAMRPSDDADSAENIEW